LCSVFRSVSDSILFFLHTYCASILYLSSCPTRRSSDLRTDRRDRLAAVPRPVLPGHLLLRRRVDHAPLESGRAARRDGRPHGHQDRKSTRLNSSHVSISYAVFCLKEKI